jgi:serine/threonine protein phosphatase 1
MTYCISDIHGEYDLFMRLLEKIGYSDSDRLIVCGDFIDKGGDSVRLAKTIFGLPNSYCIMGNHEDMFFKFYRSRMHSAIMDFDAILWHLQKYFADGHLLDWETVDKLEALPYYLEENDFICVHAGVPMDEKGRLVPRDDVSPEEFMYDRRFKEPDILPQNSKCVLFGHTPTTYINSKPQILKYPRDKKHSNSHKISDYCKIHLDTGASQSGVLGCFRVDDCREFYVFEK